MRTEHFVGRIKAINFREGRVEIANKEKDFFFVRRSDLGVTCELAIAEKYVDFTLDGKIVTEIKEYRNV